MIIHCRGEKAPGIIAFTVISFINFMESLPEKKKMYN